MEINVGERLVSCQVWSSVPLQLASSPRVLASRSPSFSLLDSRDSLVLELHAFSFVPSRINWKAAAQAMLENVANP